MSRTVPTSIQTAISNGTICSLIKITLKNGTIYAFTDHDKDLTSGSSPNIVYKAAPGLKRFRLDADSTGKVGSQEFAQSFVEIPEDDIKGGAFDEANLTVMWCDRTTFESTGDILVISRRTLGQLSWSEDGFRAEVQDLMRDLRKNLGFVTTASCRHGLFSQHSDELIGACTLNKSSYTDDFTSNGITVVSNQRIRFRVDRTLETSPPTDRATGYFDNGVVEWNSGNNAGLSAPIKKHENLGSGVYEITLFLPTLFTFQVGDGLNLVAGCDKTVATCKAKFNNFVNFGGFPHIDPERNWK